MNRYAFSTGALFPYETVDALKLIRDAGFHRAEMMPQSLRDASEKYTWDYERAGVHVYSVHYPLFAFGLLYTVHESAMDDGRKYSKELLLMCRRLGTQVLVVHPHAAFLKGYEARFEAPVVENLKWLADLAQEHGVLVAMENSPKSCRNPQLLNEYVAMLNHPNIRPMVDTTEACEAGEDPVTFLRGVKNCHIHMSDFKDPVKHLPAGEGDIDWQGVKRALADQGYKGMYVLEPAYRFYLDEVENRLRRAYEFISGLMEG